MAMREKNFAAAFSCHYYKSVTSANSEPIQPTDDILLEQVVQHLTGEARMGLIVPSITGDAYWAMISVAEDDLPSDAERWEAVLKIKQALSAHGIDCLIERGKSVGMGDYQIWLFLEDPIAANRISETLSALLTELELVDFATIIPTTSPLFGQMVQTAWLPMFGGNEDVIEKRRGGGVPTGRTVFLSEDQSVTSDQWKVITGAKRISATQFESLELATMPYQARWQDMRAGYAAGPDELQKVLDNCPFIKWCEEQQGQLTAPLRDALVSNLCRFGPEGGRKISQILRLDEKSSPAHKVARGLPRRVASFFRTAGPMSYAAIRRLGWSGDIPTWPDSPAGWGLYLDLDRILREFSALKTSPKRLADALAEHFLRDFFHLSAETQVDWLQRLSKEIDIPFEELHDLAKRYFDRIDLRGMNLGVLLDLSKSLEYTPERQGNLMYRWLLANGGKLFVDQHDTYYVVWRGTEAELGKGKGFEALLYTATGMTLATPMMKRIVRAFQAEAYKKALKVNQLTWIQTDCASFTVFLHLNSGVGGIIKLSPGSVVEMPNAVNEQDVFLARSPKMLEWKLLPLSEQEYNDGLRQFDKLVMKNMACTREDQLLYGCWALCYPLIGFVMSRPHLRAEGTSGSGKTRAMDLVSHFVYGRAQLKTPTDAANFADASMNPLVFLDNIESRDLSRGLQNFILWAVSGTQKEKRKAGTASDIIEEQIRCLVNTTGIENLSKNEIINRTIHIEFDKTKQNASGLPKSVYDMIAKERSVLMTVQMKLASRMLGRIASGDWKKMVTKLSADYPKFVLERSNEYIAMMALAAEELLPIIAPSIRINALVETWIRTQNRIAAATASGSNPIVGLLNAIFAERAHRVSLAKPRKWPYELQCDGVELRGSAAELHRTFLAAKGRHKLTYEYTSESTLSKRIEDSKDALDAAGFDVTWKQDHHKKHRVFTFAKRKPAGKVPKRASKR